MNKRMFDENNHQGNPSNDHIDLHKLEASVLNSEEGEYSSL